MSVFTVSIFYLVNFMCVFIVCSVIVYLFYCFVYLVFVVVCCYLRVHHSPSFFPILLFIRLLLPLGLIQFPISVCFFVCNRIYNNYHNIIAIVVALFHHHHNQYPSIIFITTLATSSLGRVLIQ